MTHLRFIGHGFTKSESPADGVTLSKTEATVHRNNTQKVRQCFGVFGRLSLVLFPEEFL